jgi:C-terminal processing protease CtpA/Prc
MFLNMNKAMSNLGRTTELRKLSKSPAIASRILPDKKQSLVHDPAKPKASSPDIYVETSQSVTAGAETYARADSLKPVEQLIGSRTCRLLPTANFGGYGCVLVSDEENGVICIGSIMPNSPALLGGLQQDDIILRINEESMSGKTSTEIVNIFAKETVIDAETGRGILKLEVIHKKLYLPDHLETR